MVAFVHHPCVSEHICVCHIYSVNSLVPVHFTFQPTFISVINVILCSIICFFLMQRRGFMPLPSADSDINPYTSGTDVVSVLLWLHMSPLNLTNVLCLKYKPFILPVIYSFVIPQHRRLSYSRHAVNDRDLSTQPVNYRMHMNIRRMVGERKHHKRSKRLGKVSNRVMFTDINTLQLESQFYRDKNVKYFD